MTLLVALTAAVLAGVVADLRPRRPVTAAARSDAAPEVDAPGSAGGGRSLGRVVAVVVLMLLIFPGPVGWVLATVVGGGIGAYQLRRDDRATAPGAGAVADTAALLAACLAAGAPPLTAIEAISTASPPAIAGVLAEVAGALRLGADLQLAWAPVLAQPGLRGLAIAVLRSADTVAPLADLLVDWSAELRAEQHSRARAAVQRAGIRIVLPVGLCFLPAFVLVGVLPVIAALLGPLLH